MVIYKLVYILSLLQYSVYFHAKNKYLLVILYFSSSLSTIIPIAILLVS